MNHLTIIGNLCNDPVSRQTPGGSTVCNFTVAVNRRKNKQKGEQEADFFRVAAWNELANACQKYLAKGRKVGVSGSVSVSVYTPENGEARGQLEVRASEVEFLSGRDSGSNDDGHPAEVQPAAQGNTTGGFTAVETDELPF